MDAILIRILGLKEILDSKLPMKEEDRLRLDAKFRLEFNFNSNHIEGNTLNLDETELAILKGRSTGDHELWEYDEIRAHDIAFSRIRELAGDKETPLTEMFIKGINELILVRPFYKQAETLDGTPAPKLIRGGQYKEKPNHVKWQNGDIYEYASPEETPVLMGDLMEWYRDSIETKDLQPVEIAAIWHHRFVRIHPFDDGTGRIARVDNELYTR